MSTPGGLNNLLLAYAAGSATGYEIERSLRFNSSDSAYCSRVVDLLVYHLLGPLIIIANCIAVVLGA